MWNIQKCKREIFIIMFSSIIIHICMIFVLGTWWDDYKYNVFEPEDIKKHMISAGRLDAYYIIMSINKLPVWLFRMIVIVLFMLSAILVYLIIARVSGNLKIAFGIAILYNAIPVNDVRIMKCVYPYTFSVALFWLATYLLIKDVKEKKNRNSILCCILFLLSFFTSSLMFYYMVPVALLWYCIAKECIFEKNSKEYSLFLRRIMQYWYLYPLPFLFWTVKKVAFSPDPQGLYSNYNSVTIEKCISAIKIIPEAFKAIFLGIIKSQYYLIMKNKLIFIVFGVIIVAFWGIRSKIAMQDNKMNLKQKLVGEAVGCITMICGLYPYVVIRQGGIGTEGVGGRDAILLCLGISIMIYFALEILCFWDWIQYAVITCMLVVAFLHFTYYYAGYMRDSYNHIALEIKWKQTQTIEEQGTYIYIRNIENQTVAENFYVFNAMAREVYGDSSRFISAGISNLYYLTDYEKKELMRDDRVYGYSECDLDNIKINGIMLVTYNMTEKDALRLKMIELLKGDEYKQELERYIDYKYIPFTQETSDKILQGYLDKKITNNDELLTVVKEL